MVEDKALWVAIVGAIALIFGHLVNQFFAYRLKLKDFRVSQIQKRIDALQMASYASKPPPPIGTGEDKSRYASRAINKLTVEVFVSTTTLYQSHRQMIISEFRPGLDDCAQRAHAMLGQRISGDISRSLRDAPDQQVDSESVEVMSSSTATVVAFQKAFEDARLGSIDKLYELLNKEVGL